MVKICKFFFIIILMVYDASAQWLELDTRISEFICSGISFIDENNGFAVGGAAGGGAFVMGTRNGGVSWEMKSHSAKKMYNFSDVKMIDSSTAFVCGFNYFESQSNGGIILKTIDGGSNWSIVDSMQHPGFFAMHFFNKDTGYAVGYNGIICRTYNGGSSWKKVPSLVSDNLRDIDFPTRSTGYIVAEYKKLLKTMDGGENWTVIPSGTLVTSGTQNILLATKFTSADTGYTCGSHVILKTTNGGMDWTSTQTTTFLQDIDFVSRDTGYSCGSFGNLLTTNDGGATWVTSTIGDFDRYGLYSLHFVNPKYGFTAGQDRRVFKFTKGKNPITKLQNIPKENNVNVWPNPSNGLVTISNSGELTKLEIYNTLGASVYIYYFNETQEKIVDLRHLPSGNYFTQYVDKTGKRYQGRPLIFD